MKKILPVMLFAALLMTACGAKNEISGDDTPQVSQETTVTDIGTDESSLTKSESEADEKKNDKKKEKKDTKEETVSGTDASKVRNDIKQTETGAAGNEADARSTDTNNSGGNTVRDSNKNDDGELTPLEVPDDQLDKQQGSAGTAQPAQDQPAQTQDQDDEGQIELPERDDPDDGVIELPIIPIG